MDILGTFINESEIIGISPLWKKNHPDAEHHAIYKSFCLEFIVYTKGNTIRIHSDYFNIITPEENVLQWQLAYVAAYKHILNLHAPPNRNIEAYVQLPAFLSIIETDCRKRLDALQKNLSSNSSKN